jgi:hypothetical protein
MKNSLLTTLLLTIITASPVLVSTVNLGVAQTGTNVSSIITTDTTWTKTNSPYTLIGPIAINFGVTLTIELGTTVNLNNYYIQVNGTLTAVGSGTDKININGPAQPIGGIIFTPISKGWNQQIGSGNIIENAIINQASLTAQNSAKINNNTINGGVSASNSSIVTNNYINGVVSANGNTIVNATT